MCKNSRVDELYEKYGYEIDWENPLVRWEQAAEIQNIITSDAYHIPIATYHHTLMAWNPDFEGIPPGEYHGYDSLNEVWWKKGSPIPTPTPTPTATPTPTPTPIPTPYSPDEPPASDNLPSYGLIVVGMGIAIGGIAIAIAMVKRKK